MNKAHERPAQLSSVVAIVVTYHPDLGRLEQLLQSLPSELRLVVVDNNSAVAERDAITQLLAGREGARMIRNEVNAGLAAAINQGVASLDPGEAEFLILLDQDSVPRPGSIAALHHAYRRLEGMGIAVGCVGPRLLDPSTGLEHGFHAIQGLRWVRRFPGPRDSRPVSCANLNGSGTLMRSDLFERIGELDSRLFIDHVDTDWSFRVLDSGMALFGIPNAVFDHSMGERGMRFWLMGWRVWPVRSATRHYFLFRNSIRLMRRRYTPNVWKFWGIAKLATTFTVHALCDPDRKAQVRNMLNGLKDGWRSDG